MCKAIAMMAEPTSTQAEPVTHGRRGASRARLMLPARTESFDGSYPCTLVDASQTGAQIASKSVPRTGSMMVVEIRGRDLEEMAGMPGLADKFGVVEFFGTVTWVRDGRFGIQFDEQVGYDLVVILRQIADVMDRSGTRWARERAREFVSGRN
ncbi:PilZ domain-containing protein [Altererythrobacter sp. GH1-8]|uniref:PilZ domain-containing protein n=1 Tax=Altererythrobacter sp. GH1-8 TaxID=3349333 RepID=UPI00374CA9D1